VQMHPGSWSWGLRAGALLAFWVLPFAIGTLPAKELLGMLPILRGRKP
jgi:hypothetical protein